MRDIARLKQVGEATDIAFGEPTASSPDAPAGSAAPEGSSRRPDSHDFWLLLAKKAMQAQKFNVTFDLLADRPELILHEVDLAMRGGQGENSGSTADAFAAAESASSMNGRQLTAQAREALAAGDVEKARELAIQAQQQVAAYGSDGRPTLKSCSKEAEMIARRENGAKRKQCLCSVQPDRPDTR